MLMIDHLRMSGTGIEKCLNHDPADLEVHIGQNHPGIVVGHQPDSHLDHAANLPQALSDGAHARSGRGDDGRQAAGVTLRRGPGLIATASLVAARH
jgi:hypothetical protein